MGVCEAFYEECEYFHEPVRPAKVELPDKQDDKWPECPKQFRIHTCNDSSRFCIYALIHEKFTLASSLGPADRDKVFKDQWCYLREFWPTKGEG